MEEIIEDEFENIPNQQIELYDDVPLLYDLAETTSTENNLVDDALKEGILKDGETIIQVEDETNKHDPVSLGVVKPKILHSNLGPHCQLSEDDNN